jgi:flagellar hook-length control protein FliK
MKLSFPEPAAARGPSPALPGQTGKAGQPVNSAGPPFREILKERAQGRDPGDDDPEEACKAVEERADRHGSVGAQAAGFCPQKTLRNPDTTSSGERVSETVKAGEGKGLSIRPPAGEAPPVGNGRALSFVSQAEAASLPALEPESGRLAGTPLLPEQEGLAGSRMAEGLDALFREAGEGQAAPPQENGKNAGKPAPEAVKTPAAGAQPSEPARQAEAQQAAGGGGGEESVTSPLSGGKASGVESSAAPSREVTDHPSNEVTDHPSSETTTAPAARVEGARVERSGGAPSDLYRPAEARSLEIARQVARGVEGLARSEQFALNQAASGQVSLRMQLYPEKLGRIDLRLSSGLEGMQVTILAGLQNTGQLLESRLPDLRQALSEAGLNINGLYVGIGGGETQRQPANRWQQGSGPESRPGVSGLAGSGPESADRPDARVGTASNVDYLV